MPVKKIVCITPGESERGELTSMAEHQLDKVVKKILEGEVGDSSMVFRTTNSASLRNDSLMYISNKFHKAINGASEQHYNNLISNPENITSIANSTSLGKAVITFVTQEELKNVLERLKEDGYDVVDKKEINHRYNVYAVSIDTDSKQSNFFVAKWGEE